MNDFDPKLLLDTPPFPAERVAGLADRLARLIGASGDVLLVQAEAVVALEAVAASLGRPGVKAVNIVTSPYGAWFGRWLRRAGASVVEIRAEAARPVSARAVEAALDAHPDANLLAVVHAESASGIRNPLEAIQLLARERGVLTIVDAVASLGGHDFSADALRADVVVVGPQKALAGPAGFSAVAVSKRAWAEIDRPDAPQTSTLSLVDQKRLWLDIGRGALPGTPSPLELWALAAALDRVEAEGMERLIDRHGEAAAAARDGLEALGLAPWARAEDASNLVTAFAVPEGIDALHLLETLRAADPDFSFGVGPGAERLIRLNHTGRRADPAVVHAMISVLAAALRR
ncbi:alanine--glyoxylate aminotransferase family protein [Pleomorphomonas sp. JP5]|uniref:pyridoxal-phosphate-dependent aminotransferase family protein n=1 Tax=Pleomorphomonas sp. JP5 TaxID=2942998 RepID=UPI0020436248|nr:aminotransferase class V-fold PLP-dependent enzyme [Pleomorphomonas sp. JP5]MCM5558518.1 aminotransferase class V-fold PLP-dependent enzyme [Pleomorphomonas sp. JP5]